MYPQSLYMWIKSCFIPELKKLTHFCTIKAGFPFFFFFLNLYSLSCLHRRGIVKQGLFFPQHAFFLFNYNSFTVLVTDSRVAFSSYLNFTFWDEKAKEKNSTQNHNLWWKWIWTDKLCCCVRAISCWIYVLQMGKWQKKFWCVLHICPEGMR